MMENVTQSQKWYQEHKEEKKAKSHLYRQAHKEQEKERYAVWRSKLKLEVFTHYSNGEPKCAVCTEKNLDLLTLDHISGDGKEHHKANKYSYGTQMWFWARKNNYPAIFQVLCYKHNTAKGHEAFIPKTQLEEWLVRLERPRAGSIFDNHVELGMMYVLKKLLGKPVKTMEDQAVILRDATIKRFYDEQAKERSLRNLWQGMNLLKDCEDIYEELEGSDVPDYIQIMMVNVWNGIKKLDDAFKESSEPLSSEEIKDVEIAEKEFSEGKCKTFKNAEDLIADLHKKRKATSERHFLSVAEAREKLKQVYDVKGERREHDK